MNKSFLLRGPLLWSNIFLFKGNKNDSLVKQFLYENWAFYNKDWNNPGGKYYLNDKQSEKLGGEAPCWDTQLAGIEGVASGGLELSTDLVQCSFCPPALLRQPPASAHQD